MKNTYINSDKQKKINKIIFQKKENSFQKNNFKNNTNLNNKINKKDNNKSRNSLYLDIKDNDKIPYRKIIKNAINPINNKRISRNIFSNIYNNSLNSVEFKKKNFFHKKIKSFNETDSNINYSNNIRYKSPLLENKNISNNLKKNYFNDVSKNYKEIILEYKNKILLKNNK